MQKVTAKTRTSGIGSIVVCPHCETEATVGHFSWASMVCDWCTQEVDKVDWSLSPKNPSAVALGKKGGSAKSPAKTKAARENASRPRKNKEMPTFAPLGLIKLAHLELEKERRRCEVVGEQFYPLFINGYSLNEILADHISRMERGEL